MKTILMATILMMIACNVFAVRIWKNKIDGWTRDSFYATPVYSTEGTFEIDGEGNSVLACYIDETLSAYYFLSGNPSVLKIGTKWDQLGYEKIEFVFADSLSDTLTSFAIQKGFGNASGSFDFICNATKEIFIFVDDVYFKSIWF